MRLGRSSSGRGEFRPVYHPAGLDDALRAALDDLLVGRWMATRTLLARTGDDLALRTSRSQVLGVGAARSAVVQVWLDEEPHSVDARMIRARVATHRAVQAARRRLPGAAQLEDEARALCHEAAEAAWDPVPWICLLTLAQLDAGQRRPEHRELPPETLLQRGPWGLLNEAVKRDQYNREAFHRMLQLSTQHGGSHAYALDFARWVGSWAPAGSPLLVLPLYAHAEHYLNERKRGRGDALVHRQWSREDILRDTLRAMDGWLERSDPATRSQLDLNYLAHALSAAGQHSDARLVFEALGPYATELPWAYVTDDPERSDLATAEFLRARALALRNT
ncbi:hypothetical protein SRB5_52380 [Streptomyces sp. RB5]|uniref:Uncharacterized protein n=1 Tax=Streptomyces smaragdinus TaxID=2585196 RepID=A0A7K0CNR8_9ACTN|nr:hypothetical protein [Streptomyces smaragdinus]MQY15061.1 hypothetical protein [Streptomyces smaragdinus]